MYPIEAFGQSALGAYKTGGYQSRTSAPAAAIGSLGVIDQMDQGITWTDATHNVTPLKLLVALSGRTWEPTLTTSMKNDILAGLSADPDGANGFEAEVLPSLSSGAVTRVSDTVVHIQMGIQAALVVAQESVSLAIPDSAISNGSGGDAAVTLINHEVTGLVWGRLEYEPSSLYDIYLEVCGEEDPKFIGQESNLFRGIFANTYTYAYITGLGGPDVFGQGVILAPDYNATTHNVIDYGGITAARNGCWTEIFPGMYAKWYWTLNGIYQYEFDWLYFAKWTAPESAYIDNNGRALNPLYIHG